MAESRKIVVLQCMAASTDFRSIYSTPYPLKAHLLLSFPALSACSLHATSLGQRNLDRSWAATQQIVYCTCLDPPMYFLFGFVMVFVLGSISIDTYRAKSPTRKKMGGSRYCLHAGGPKSRQVFQINGSWASLRFDGLLSTCSLVLEPLMNSGLRVGNGLHWLLFRSPSMEAVNTTYSRGTHSIPSKAIVTGSPDTASIPKELRGKATPIPADDTQDLLKAWRLLYNSGSKMGAPARVCVCVLYIDIKKHMFLDTYIMQSHISPKDHRFANISGLVQFLENHTFTKKIKESRTGIDWVAGLRILVLYLPGMQLVAVTLVQAVLHPESSSLLRDTQVNE